MTTSHLEATASHVTEAGHDAEVDRLERAASYTLADAVREGSAGSEQLFHGFGDRDRSCAMQAAINAAKTRGYM